ncbi:MAG: PDZ domain-containing protein [Acidobacteriota bacterium]|nr:PDZ domain-containing protein [Acidobacteriota bacterium]
MGYPPDMATNEPAPTPAEGPGASPPPAARRRVTRETRLLLLTIGVSVAALLLLARFRFPLQVPIVNPAPAPLEQLAARATYDELGSIIAQLQVRVQPGLAVLHIAPLPSSAPADAPLDSQYVTAVRVDRQTLLVALGPGGRVQGLVGSSTAVPVVLARDPVQHVALVRLPGNEDAPDWLRERTPSLETPGYFAVAEGGRGGLTLRPLFVGRLDPVNDPRWTGPLLAMGGYARAPAGSFIFTLDGSLVGLVIDDQGMRLVVPVSNLRGSVTRLMQGNAAQAGALGLQVQRLTPRLAEALRAPQGVVVAGIDAGGPAAGSLQPADVIQTLDGEPTYSPEAFEHWTSTIPAGATATITFLRQGRPMTASIVAQPPRAATAPARSRPVLGLSLRATPGVGAQVMRVQPDSAAARAGLLAGDFIVRFGGTSAPAPALVTRAFGQAAPGTYLVASVERNGRPLVVALRKP